MSTHKASLLAAIVLVTLPAAALAEGRHMGDGPPPLGYLAAEYQGGYNGAGTWDGEWQGGWEDEATYHGTWRGTYVGLDGVPVEAEYRGTFIGESRFESERGHRLHRDDHGWREERRRYRHERDRDARHDDPRAGGQRFAYSSAQRQDWLDQCSGGYPMTGRYDREGAERGAMIGGALGAIGGGIAGNRIAGRGDRLEGTLLGAGLAGVAGAALGSAIGSGSGSGYGPDRMAWCEDYLERYEAGASGYGYGAAPVTWVRVPIIRERARGCGCEEVVEEWVEERPAPQIRRVIPRQAPDKRVRVR